MQYLMETLDQNLVSSDKKMRISKIFLNLMLGGCGLTFAGRVNGENGNSTGFCFDSIYYKGDHLLGHVQSAIKFLGLLYFWHFCSSSSRTISEIFGCDPFVSDV